MINKYFFNLPSYYLIYLFHNLPSINREDEEADFHYLEEMLENMQDQLGDEMTW